MTLPLVQLKILRYAFVRLTDWSSAQALRPHWRLYYNPTPGAEVSCGERCCRLDDSVILLLPPHTEFRQVLKEPCESLYVHFSLGNPFDRIRGSFYAIPVCESLRPQVSALIAGERRGRDVSVDEVAAAPLPLPWKAIQLQAFLLSVVALVPAEDWAASPADHRIDRLVALMEAEPFRAWGNHELAGEVNLSMNAMVRLFRKTMGVPPGQYLTRIRLDRAGLLLLTTDYSIERIAEECGFCDRFHFSRIFQRRFHCGPATYRRESTA